MSVADELKKLADLRSQGLLTDAEFEEQKRALLDGRGEHRSSSVAMPAAWTDVPLKNKWWFQWIIGLLVPFVGVVPLLCFKSYQRDKSGDPKRVSVGFKIFAVALLLAAWPFWLSNLARYMNGGESLATCDSPAARAVLNAAVEGNPANFGLSARLLDLTNVEEVSADVSRSSRRCNGTLTLNSGREAVGYTLSNTSDGSLMVEISLLPFERRLTNNGVVGQQPVQSRNDVEAPPYESPAYDPLGDFPDVASIPEGARFSDYSVPIMAGPFVTPTNFGDFETHRVEVLEAVASGPNFAGTFALVPISCGDNCNSAIRVDLRGGPVL